MPRNEIQCTAPASDATSALALALRPKFLALALALNPVYCGLVNTTDIVSIPAVLYRWQGLLLRKEQLH